MGIDVSIEIVTPRKLAAVRRQVTIGAVASAWRAALAQVWNCLHSQPGLPTDGHNIFLYHHPARRSDPMNVDFGVEVTRSFSPSGEVYEASTPAGATISCTGLTMQSSMGKIARESLRRSFLGDLQQLVRRSLEA